MAALDDQDLAFAEFDALLTRLHPGHAGSRRPHELGADAPPLMAQLWRAIGVGAATVPAPFSVRERGTAAAAAVADVFEDWFADVPLCDAWDVDFADSSAGWARLPAVGHVVAVSAREIVVTDDRAADDPPVLVMRRDGSPLTVWHESYVQWAIWTILSRLMRHRLTRIPPGRRPAGRPVLAPVYPRLVEVGRDVWTLQEPGLIREDVRPAQPDTLMYRSIGDYFDYVHSLPPDDLPALFPPSSAWVRVEAPGLGPELSGFRIFDLPGRLAFGRRGAIGRWAGAHVWLTLTSSDEVTVRFDPRDEPAVRGWLAQRGLPVLAEQRMPDDHDASGG